MRKINTAIKILILIIIVSLCTINLWSIAGEYQNQAKIYSELQSYIPQRQTKPCPQPGTDPEPDDSDYEITDPVRENVELPSQELLPDDTFSYDMETIIEPMPIVNQFIVDMQNEINQDIIAWLSITGTDIDYPVVKATDNDYYLQHDIYGNEAGSGTLFTDYRNPGQFSGFYTIIHGHNMRNRSMFGTLRSYSNPDYLEENRRGILCTSTNTYNIEIFAYMVTSFDDPEIYANPLSEEVFLEYVKENARVYREPECEVTKVVALSTCAYDFDGARIVVLASLREQ